ncbi:MAG TPA: CDP-alcohol phosphatidyltransferase family protein [Rubrobacteraceae bacterium]|nr:CDP-alcohol phosphatidyltransferase family protein [Rubrobacteraceae bacterium]
MKEFNAEGMMPISAWLRLRASAVHLYTASGAVLTLLILVAAFNGHAVMALWLGLAALVIDSTDGLLARRFRVKELLPSFDGMLLDNIVDYMTYALAPVLLLWTTGYLPNGASGVALAALPILASSYQFCRVDAKTGDGAETDHFFLGFPSYWNVLAFYAIVFDLGAGAVAAILIVCSVLVFVPIRYVYPSRTLTFRKLNLTLTSLWLVSYVVILLQMPNPGSFLLAFSLLYLVYYFGASLYLTADMLKKPSRVR